jgi:hypothetical protein
MISGVTPNKFHVSFYKNSEMIIPRDNAKINLSVNSNLDESNQNENLTVRNTETGNTQISVDTNKSTFKEKALQVAKILFSALTTLFGIAIMMAGVGFALSTFGLSLLAAIPGWGLYKTGLTMLDRAIDNKPLFSESSPYQLPQNISDMINSTQATENDV